MTDFDVFPQNLDAEESLLGAMLQSPHAVDAARIRVTADDFYRPSHGLIFDAILALHDAGQAVEALLVADKLERLGQLEKAGGRLRLHELSRLVPATSNAAHYARIVRQQALARRQLQALESARAELRNGGLGDETRREVVAALAESGCDAVAATAWLEPASDLLTGPDPGLTPFAVEGLLAEGAIGAIQGAPKVGKTWLVLELAVALVTGQPALGRFAVPRAGPVLVVCEESGRDALRRRLDSLARGHGLGHEDLAPLHVAANAGVRLGERGWQERLLDACRSLAPRAVFLDPFVRLKGVTVDENAQRDVGPLLDFLRELRDRSGAAVVFVHHSGHEGGHLRGSSDLEAYWESKLSVGREGAFCTLAAEHRESPETPRLRYRIEGDADGRSIRLAPEASGRRQARNLEDDIAAFLADCPGATTTDIARGVQAADDAVRRTLRSSRFRSVPPPPGRNANARCWTLTDQLVSPPQTSSDELPPGHTADSSSGGGTPPIGGQPSDGLAPSLSLETSDELAETGEAER